MMCYHDSDTTTPPARPAPRVGTSESVKGPGGCNLKRRASSLQQVTCSKPLKVAAVTVAISYDIASRRSVISYGISYVYYIVYDFVYIG